MISFRFNSARGIHFLAALCLILWATDCTPKPNQAPGQELSLTTQNAKITGSRRAAVILKQVNHRHSQAQSTSKKPAFIPSDILCLFETEENARSENSQADQWPRKVIYLQEAEELKIPACTESQQKLLRASVEFCPGKPSYLFCQETKDTQPNGASDDEPGKSNESWACLCSGVNCDATSGFEILPSLPSCTNITVH